MAEANWHPKREARNFEPPPWERERFEAIKRDREEREAAVQPAESAAPAGEAEQRPAEAVQPPVDRAGKALPVPDEQVAAMLSQLSAEEPKVDEHLKEVGVFGSALAMFVGVCMLVWGLIAAVRMHGSFAGTVGSLVMMAMGLVLGLTGLWIGWRVTNRGDR